MPYTKQLRFAAFAVCLGLSFTGCATSSNQAADIEIPVIDSLGSRPVEYTQLSQLATNSSAIVVVSPTGQESEKPLPTEQGGTSDSAPTQYVEMQVNEVINGSLDATTIQVVSPGDDQRTGRSVLLTADSYILFLTPAMYAANQPAGGYAVTGGPAGAYIQLKDDYLRLDEESPELPAKLDLTDTSWPDIVFTEAELLKRGPR